MVGTATVAKPPRVIEVGARVPLRGTVVASLTTGSTGVGEPNAGVGNQSAPTGVGVVAVVIFVGCENGNYIPPVTPQMTRAFPGKPGADVSTMERGRTLFAHRCIECHTLPPMWKYSRQDWPQIVNDMSHRSNLKPEERDAVIAYILAVRANQR